MAYQQINNSPLMLDDTTNRIAGILQPDGTVDAVAVLTSGSGAPVDAVKALIVTDMTNADADITLTAVDYGKEGNTISVTYIDPGAINIPLSVGVNGRDIKVTLQTNAAGAINIDALDVCAALNADPRIAALVVATYEGTGLGIVNAKAKANLASGVSMFPLGPISTVYLDTATSTLYRKSAAHSWAAFAGAGDILTATITSGDTTHAPTGDAVFNALALKAPLANAALTGTTTVAQLQPVILQLTEKTPVNAANSAGVLTLTGNAQNNEQVVIGGQTYTWQIAIAVSGVKASGTLQFGANASEGDVVTIGTTVYKMRAAIGAGTAATEDLVFVGLPLNGETVTLDTDVWTYVAPLTEAAATSTLTAGGPALSDGNSVTIGTTKYTFRETLAVAYDVLIEAAILDSLANLIAAINGAAGVGVKYGTGTAAHPDVTAVAGIGDTVDITAKAVGTAGNSIATTELSIIFSWTGAVMGGGVDPVAREVVIGGTAEACIDNLVAAVNGAAGEGTTYSTGSTPSATVTASKTAADTFTATAQSVGFAGNSIAVGETLTNAAWDGGAVVLSGGVDAEAPYDVLISAINARGTLDNLEAAITYDGGAGTNEGTLYGTGTLAHPTVTATTGAGDTTDVEALAFGEAGNLIATTTDVGAALWTAATLTGGEEAESAYDVLIGGTPEISIDNLVLAVTAGAGEGTNYGTGTVANPDVTAAKTAADAMTATAIVAGVSGNAFPTTTTMANATWAAGNLAGGVNGTVAVANETCADATWLYHAVAANTVAGKNWRRVALGTAY